MGTLSGIFKSGLVDGSRIDGQQGLVPDQTELVAIVSDVDFGFDDSMISVGFVRLRVEIGQYENYHFSLNCRDLYSNKAKPEKVNKILQWLAIIDSQSKPGSKELGPVSEGDLDLIKDIDVVKDKWIEKSRVGIRIGTFTTDEGVDVNYIQAFFSLSAEQIGSDNAEPVEKRDIPF